MTSQLYVSEETGVPAEKHRLTPSHWQLSHMPRPRFEPRYCQSRPYTRMKSFMHEEMVVWKFMHWNEITMDENETFAQKFSGMRRIPCMKLCTGQLPRNIFGATKFSCMKLSYGECFLCVLIRRSVHYMYKIFPSVECLFHCILIPPPPHAGCLSRD